MCPSLNEVGELNSLNEYACLRESMCVYVRGIEKERELVSVCESVCVWVCVSVCVLVGVGVCRGTGSRNGVES